MSLEHNILNKINTLSSNLIIALFETRTLLNEIKSDVKRNNNTYFNQNPEIINRLNDILTEEGIKQLSFLLTDYKNYVQYKATECCNHQWIKDTIDIDPDRSQTIVYCRLCEVSQKI